MSALSQNLKQIKYDAVAKFVWQESLENNGTGPVKPKLYTLQSPRGYCKINLSLLNEQAYGYNVGKYVCKQAMLAL